MIHPSFHYLKKNRLRVPHHIVALIRKSHLEIKRKIKAGLEYFQKAPQAGKSLKEDLGGLKSDRSGHFRIICRISMKNIIIILAIGPRTTIDKGAFGILVKRG